MHNHSLPVLEQLFKSLTRHTHTRTHTSFVFTGLCASCILEGLLNIHHFLLPASDRLTPKDLLLRARETLNYSAPMTQSSEEKESPCTEEERRRSREESNPALKRR